MDRGYRRMGTEQTVGSGLHVAGALSSNTRGGRLCQHRRRRDHQGTVSAGCTSPVSGWPNGAPGIAQGALRWSQLLARAHGARDLALVLAQSRAIGGGYANTTSGYASTISGGKQNTATGPRSVISGGWSNAAGDGYSIRSRPTSAHPDATSSAQGGYERFIAAKIARRRRPPRQDRG
jgi:hypothetical protein